MNELQDHLYSKFIYFNILFDMDLGIAYFHWVILLKNSTSSQKKKKNETLENDM